MSGRWWWSTSALRWLGDAACASPFWPYNTSYLTPSWWWAQVRNASIVDDVVWSVVSAFESLALVSMLCCFFLFCGCTV